MLFIRNPYSFQLERPKAYMSSPLGFEERPFGRLDEQHPPAADLRPKA